MIVKLTHRRRPDITKTIRDVADVDSCMNCDGELCLKVRMVNGWLGLYPLISWCAEVTGGYQNGTEKP